MAAFNGQLNINKIYAFSYNMLLSQIVNSKNYTDAYSDFLNASRTDVGLYGDQKPFYETYAPKISKWKGDDESTDLLETKKYRVHGPECQTVQIDTQMKVVLVLDKYLTKNFWMNEAAFEEFNSTMLSWIRDVIGEYTRLTFNVFAGTEESSTGKQQRTVNVTEKIGSATGEEANRIEAQAIAEDEMILCTDLMDNTVDYIDYGAKGMKRGFNKEDLVKLMPVSVAARIHKMDVPSLFHKDGLFEGIKTYVYPDRMFGKINTSTKAGDGVARSRIYQVLTGTDGKEYELLPGDFIPTVCTAPANTSYNEDNTILYKMFTKDSIPWLDQFEASGSFYNVQALNEKYVTVIGHNTLEHLAGKPCITVRKA